MAGTCHLMRAAGTCQEHNPVNGRTCLAQDSLHSLPSPATAAQARAISAAQACSRSCRLTGTLCQVPSGASASAVVSCLLDSCTLAALAESCRRCRWAPGCLPTAWR